MLIGTSFVITKKGLQDAEKRHGFEGDGFSYLKSPVWWAGIITSTATLQWDSLR
jgi:magnesium transporter